MRIRLLDSRLGLTNSTTRLPFRYGKACLTKCPQVVVEAVIEVDGRRQSGFSGDCLPPGWFDKSPAKDFRHQIVDMLTAFKLAQGVFADEFRRPRSMFDGWYVSQERVHELGRQREWPGLLSGFGSSLMERALIDAMCRTAQLGFAQFARRNVMGIDAGRVHTELSGIEPRAWLPAEPRRSMFVRHTIGLADPITEDEIPVGDRLDDDYPQALEQYVQRFGIRYFKIKVSNQLDTDRRRLRSIANVVQSHLGDAYVVTLDGNEQYSKPADFDELIEVIQQDPELGTLWRNTQLIEQPLPRDIALRPDQTDAIRRLCQQKAVIIDESDEQLDAYRQALRVGYRGISSKNCKGPIRSLLNAGLTWKLNHERNEDWYAMSGEDLCSVGIIPVQADLCLAATLGLTHVERNGHHYHPGLSYLPAQQRESALRLHGDFYGKHGSTIRPTLCDGRFQIDSLHGTGFGFSVLPDFDALQSPEQWDFDSLGL